MSGSIQTEQHLNLLPVPLFRHSCMMNIKTNLQYGLGYASCYVAVYCKWKYLHQKLAKNHIPISNAGHIKYTIYMYLHKNLT